MLGQLRRLHLVDSRDAALTRDNLCATIALMWTGLIEVLAELASLVMDVLGDWFTRILKRDDESA